MRGRAAAHGSAGRRQHNKPRYYAARLVVKIPTPPAGRRAASRGRPARTRRIYRNTSWTRSMYPSSVSSAAIRPLRLSRPRVTMTGTMMSALTQ